MNRHHGVAPTGIMHATPAPGDPGDLEPSSLTPGRSAHRPRRGPGASGHADHESQLIWCTELGDQANEGLAQVRDRRIKGVPLATGPPARTQLSVSAPHTVLVLPGGVHRGTPRQGQRGPRPRRVASFTVCRVQRADTWFPSRLVKRSSPRATCAMTWSGWRDSNSRPPAAKAHPARGPGSPDVPFTCDDYLWTWPDAAGCLSPMAPNLAPRNLLSAANVRWPGLAFRPGQGKIATANPDP